MAFELQPSHGLPVAVAICSCFLTVWAGFGVGKARKKYGIKYPQMYAESSHPNANAFNCYQRAHQNVLENFPQFIVLLTLASVKRPTVAAAAGALRLIGFIRYVQGYQTGNPENRQKGMVGYLGLLTLLGLSIELTVSLLMS
eukprot:jgi/Undpi1/1010/HiC_scaffold_10.g04474.m1